MGPAWQPPAAREVRVARQVSHTGFTKKLWKKGLDEMSDEELHGVIAEGRKAVFNHRLDVWRKKQPGIGGRYKAQHRIAVAKTLLKQREIDANAEAAKNAKQEDLPPLSEQFDVEEVDDSYTKWYAKPGKHNYRLPYPRFKKSHVFPEKYEAWK